MALDGQADDLLAHYLARFFVVVEKGERKGDGLSLLEAVE